MEMNLTEWKDAILLTAGFVLSVVAGLIGAKIQRTIDRYGEQRPLNQLLNFGKDDLLFVFPHREEITEAILPRTSTEDFLAMNNFISALITLGWNRRIGVRDTGHNSPDIRDKKRNLVIICSPKSNSLTTELQTQLKQKSFRFFSFEHASDGRWYIWDGDGKLESKSYEQEDEYIKNGVDRHLLPTKSFEDYAVVTKVSNPWNSKNKVLLLAGIRGIGTWAAAECMKKEWKQIYNLLPNKHKDIDYSALLRINYHNCDIASITVLRVMHPAV
jgi:hypothetical protein